MTFPHVPATHKACKWRTCFVLFGTLLQPWHTGLILHWRALTQLQSGACTPTRCSMFAVLPPQRCWTSMWWRNLQNRHTRKTNFSETCTSLPPYRWRGPSHYRSQVNFLMTRHVNYNLQHCRSASVSIDRRQPQDEGRRVAWKWETVSCCVACL